MTVSALSATLAAAAALALSHAARADTFTWNPGAAGLSAPSVTADALILGDFAQIRFGNGGTTFLDDGIMPVLGYALGGRSLGPPPASGGVFIRYSGSGAQTLSPQGFPTAAVFERLTYEIVGYDGQAAFGFAPDGSAQVGSAQSGSPLANLTTLQRGTLVAGQLAYAPGPDGLTIVGAASTTVDQAAPSFVAGAPLRFDVTFIHPQADYAFTSPTTLRIAGGAGSTGTYRFALDVVTEVPEPASLALLASTLLAAALLGLTRPRA